MPEYDHMAELGLSPDKQLLCCNTGFVTRTNVTRGLCERYIRDGGRLYDALCRYETVTTYSLSREDGIGSVARAVVPFLRAGGLTDEDAYRFSGDNVRLMDGAAEAVDYLWSQLPSFMATDCYEHEVLALAEATGLPLASVTCCALSFDKVQVDRKDAKALREMADAITKLRLSDELYSVTDSRYLTHEDSKLVDTVDGMLLETVPGMGFADDLRHVPAMSASEKAYALLEIIRKNAIGMDDTVAIGTGNSDYQALDLVRDSSGLAISYNGDEYAVRGSNVAVLGDSPITVAVLANEFYNGGIESVFSMVRNWSREYLQTHACADRNLMDRFLEKYPRGLPRVRLVTPKTVSRIVSESAEYRRKVYDPRRV